MQVEYQIKLKQQAEIISGTAWPLGMPAEIISPLSDTASYLIFSLWPQSFSFKILCHLIIKVKSSNQHPRSFKFVR